MRINQKIDEQNARKQQHALSILQSYIEITNPTAKYIYWGSKNVFIASFAKQCSVLQLDLQTEYFTASKLHTYLLMFPTQVNCDGDFIYRRWRLPPCSQIAVHHIRCVVRKTGTWCIAVRKDSQSRRLLAFHNTVIFFQRRSTRCICCSRLKQGYVRGPTWSDSNENQGNQNCLPYRHLWRLAFSSIGDACPLLRKWNLIGLHKLCKLLFLNIIQLSFCSPLRACVTLGLIFWLFLLFLTPKDKSRPQNM